MNKIFSNEHVKTNIDKINKKNTRLLPIRRLNYLQHNKKTTSIFLNNYLNTLAINLSKPINENNIKVIKDKSSKQYYIIKNISLPDSNILTYKGINLGSAINMKLSVQLASLLKDKDL